MLDMKRKLIEDRRRNGAQTKLQKDAIAKVMEEVRSNASKANKIITQALTGKISLETLIGSEERVSKSKKKKRSKSAVKLKPIDSSARPSHSAGDITQSFKSNINSEAETPIKAYISPYDANFANN